jgi:hypothetical protein
MVTCLGQRVDLLTPNTGMVRWEYMRLIPKLNQRQREVLANKLGELGNIAIGSLVFGFVLRSEAFNSLSVVLGLGIAVAAYCFAVLLEK